jgi:hypothetical protein
LTVFHLLLDSFAAYLHHWSVQSTVTLISKIWLAWIREIVGSFHHLLI